MMLDRDAVAAREAARRAAIIAVDKAALADLLSETLIWTHATGATDSKASYLAVLGAKSRFTVIEPQVEEITLGGAAAAVKSEFAMTIQPNEGAAIALRTFALGVWMVEPDGVLRLTHFQSGTMA